MKKDNYIQRAYDEGFCDGVNQACRIIEASRPHHNVILDSVIKTLVARKPKVK